MPTNFPGPYEVRVFYTVVPTSGLKSHVFRFSVDLTTDPDPGVNPTTLEANNLVGTPVNLVTWVEALVEFVAELYQTTSDFNTAELWRYEEGTFNSEWIASWTLGIEGLSASVTVEDAQLIYTFRTMEGGIGKLDLRGTIHGSAITLSYPSGNDPLDDVATYAAGNGTIIIGRDNGHFVVPIKILRGANEKAFKERLRP